MEITSSLLHEGIRTEVCSLFNQSTPALNAPFSDVRLRLVSQLVARGLLQWRNDPGCREKTTMRQISQRANGNGGTPLPTKQIKRSRHWCYFHSECCHQGSVLTFWQTWNSICITSNCRRTIRAVPQHWLLYFGAIYFVSTALRTARMYEQTIDKFRTATGTKV